MFTRQAQLRDDSADAHTATGAAGEQGTLAAEDARATGLARLQRVWAVARGPYPTLISRVVLGVLFLFTGVTKALDPVSFESSIRAYQLVPGGFVPIMAYALPWLEILLGAYLLLGLYLRWTAIITGALLIIFMVAMGQALARGLTLQCGCFGAAIGGVTLREDVNIGSILRDAVWLLMAVHLVVAPSVWTVDERLRRRSALMVRSATARDSVVPTPVRPRPVRNTPATSPSRTASRARQGSSRKRAANRSR
jgi:uncharacterized membrane protein YphA (DoxX/SURF4 family)